MLQFKKLFPSKCAVIGMIHVDALPGTALYKGSIQNIVKNACKEAELYMKYKINGILIENMFDIPYLSRKHINPETTAMMCRIGSEVRKIINSHVPCGVQILAGANKEAIAVAQACEFQFIRAEGFVFSHIADEGFIDADAGPLLRYRKQIMAEDILIFCDVKKKHSSHAITNDVSLEETVNAAEFFLADGIILTGRSTGSPTNVQDLKIVKQSCKLPVIIGSGVTINNVKEYINADALIVGSYFKESGHWNSKLSGNKIKEFMNEITQLI